jgi:hypothetical protein
VLLTGGVGVPGERLKQGEEFVEVVWVVQPPRGPATGDWVGEHAGQSGDHGSNGMPRVMSSGCILARSGGRCWNLNGSRTNLTTVCRRVNTQCARMVHGREPSGSRSGLIAPCPDLRPLPPGLSDKAGLDGRGTIGGGTCPIGGRATAHGGIRR